MSESTAELRFIEQITGSFSAFVQDLREQGIHVGIQGTCPVDGQPWPCDVVTEGED